MHLRSYTRSGTEVHCMVKQRFSTADCAAEIGCLKQRVLGFRLANIYDINPKTYLLKLARSGDDGEKVFLVLESGTRFHTTQWAKDKAETPSNFTLKLRKHLRTRRLEDVRQLGVDRIIDFSFGSGEACHHLILELFAQGNVILTDAKYEILTLLRSHRDDAKGVAIMARHPYPLQTVRLRKPVSEELLREALATADPKATARSVVSGLLPYGTALCDHVILAAGLRPQSSVASITPDQQQALLEEIKIAGQLLAGFDSQPPQGFIWQARQGAGRRGGGNAQEGGPPEDESAPLVYDDFDALPLRQNEGKSVLAFDTFDAALDEFFAKIEGQKAQQVQAQQEVAVLSKVEKIRLDQTQRAQALEREANVEELKASLIEYNLEAVDGAIAAVRGALASGLNWKELKRLIKAEGQAGNPVATLVHSLELEQNRVTLLLSNFLDEEEGDDDALTRPATKVEIDLDLNAYANARLHYDSRKAKAAKQQKTVEQNAKALKAAEKTAQHKLTQVKSAKTVQQLRKPYWFEKFQWFITSENYLVVSGRDMQQNELLVKRYLVRGDVYVHAELHGASTTVVKNHAPDAPVPPMSIAQAGCACVCRSKAWEAKIVTSAWWVHHDQVSKTAPTGEYLPTGSFIIRGKKNFLPPQPLIMGLAFMFRLDDSSLAGHVGERAVRGADGDESTAPPLDDGAESVEEDPLEDGEQAEAAGQAGAGESGRTALDAFMESAADPFSLSHRRYGLPEPGDGEEEAELHAREASEPVDHSNGGGDAASVAAGSDGLRHLSAKERRDAKKRGGGAVAGLSTEETGQLAEARKAEAARRAAKQQADLQASSEAAAAAVRGKKGKAKKAQAKYANQDEEDRQLVLQVLNPAGKKKGKAEKKEARKARRQEQGDSGGGMRRAPPTAAELASVGAHLDARQRGTQPSEEELGAVEAARQAVTVQQLAVANGSSGQSEPCSAAAATTEELQQQQTAAAETEENEAVANGSSTQSEPSSAAAATEEAQQQQQTAAAEAEENKGVSSNGAEAEEDTKETPEQSSSGENSEDGDASNAGEVADTEPQAGGDAEAAEVAALLGEEQVELLPDAELQRLREIDALTGQPRQGDILLHALPMCAPYSALQGYKYRLKLTPGTQRKGKAGKQAVELMTRAADVPPREKELIKGVPEMEVINAMVGSVKISMPGLQRIKNQARSQKKKNKASS